MKLRFLQSTYHTRDIASFVFQPEEAISWRAGQSIRLEIPCGFSSDERRFTISSAPHEKNIAITTRISDSDFKQALAALTPGAIIDGYAIEGNFLWYHETSPKLFIAGGLGITPYYALLKDRIFHQQPISAKLVYIAPKHEQLFKTEFLQWQADHAEFLVGLLENRTALEDTLQAELSNDQLHTIYLSGSPRMVRSLYHLAAQQRPDIRIFTDSFSGYHFDL